MNQMIDTHPGEANLSPPDARLRRWLTWLLMLVVFASGAGIGVGGTLLYVRNRVLHAFHHPEKAPKAIADRLRSKLTLHDAQAERVESVLRAHQLELRKIRRAVQPQVEAQLDQVEEEVSEVLDEGQRAKWHDMIAHLRKVWIPPRPEEPNPLAR